ncbi:DNA helicase [Ranunculus cassubicifolius]
MDVDDPPAPTDQSEISSERMKAFEDVFGKHMMAKHLEQISISDIEQVVNMGGAGHYTRAEIVIMLEGLQRDNRVMLADNEIVHMV